MENTFKQNLYNLLRTDPRLWNEKTKEFNETLFKDLIDKLDEKIIELLLSNEETKDKFFKQIKDVLVLKQGELKFFIDENKLDNSYTQYQIKIGLRVGNRLLSDRSEVVLDWPFKDCVLEGGMTKEDQKRNEFFFNQVLAKDEIDRLEDPKALINWKRYTSSGEEKVKELKRNKDGTLKENLIIRGNNLLALHSLKEQFNNLVKMIYIDPPYNLGGDSFGYNDNFNHSSWLTFMKNRLEIAWKLLRKDGAIFVQIDLHELGYLLVLMDEIFGINNRVQVIAIKTASPAGFKTVNPGPIDVTEYILFYTKDRKSYKFKRNFVEINYDENYNLYIDNLEEEPEKWNLVSLRDWVYKLNGIEIGTSPQASSKNAEAVWGEHWKAIRYQVMSKFALENSEKVVSVRDPHKPSLHLKEALKVSKDNPNKILCYKKSSGDEELENDKSDSYLYNGGALSFYSNKIMVLDGKKTPTMMLTDFWDDLRWDGIAREGGVKLKNGKKPEKLIKRIIEISADKNDIILDFFLGSGTTAAVAHKLGCQYIGIEQLDYEENDAIVRLRNVINGDQTGISKSVNWQSGGDFIYLELARWNQEAKDKILQAGSLEELKKLFDHLYERYFLNYNVKTKEFREKVIKEDDFKNLSLIEQKKLFVDMLDINQMYVNFSERADTKYGISEEDIKLSEDFYNFKK